VLEELASGAADPDPARGGTVWLEGLRTASEDPPESAPPSKPMPEDAGMEALRRLDRRTARILVIAWQGQDRDAVLRRLQADGYWRLEVVSDASAALGAFNGASGAPFRLLVVNLEPSLWEGIETVVAVRQLEPTLRAFGGLPVAFMSGHADPLLDFLDKPGLGVVALEDPDRGRCNRVLDRLLAITAGSRPESGWPAQGPQPGPPGP
jgi:hypothetical protein